MSAIDLRTLPPNVPVMCIPRVFPNIDEKRIRRIFDELSMGEIDHIDIIGKTTEKGEKFNRVFVHFRKWHSNQNADTARERLINGKEIKIIYDEPWFWKISAYREQPRQRTQEPRTQDPRQRPQQPRPQARLQFDEDEGAKTLKDEFGRDISLKPATNHHNHQQEQRPPKKARPTIEKKDQVPMPVKKRSIITNKKPVALEEGEVDENK
jgi:hypothetical protein